MKQGTLVNFMRNSLGNVTLRQLPTRVLSILSFTRTGKSIFTPPVRVNTVPTYAIPIAVSTKEFNAPEQYTEHYACLQVLS